LEEQNSKILNSNEQLNITIQEKLIILESANKEKIKLDELNIKLTETIELLKKDISNIEKRSNNSTRNRSS